MLSGDYSISLEEIARHHPISGLEKRQLARSLEDNYLEPFRQKLLRDLGPSIERADYSEACQKFQRIVERSGIGPRVYLAVQLIEGASEWISSVVRLGVELEVSQNIPGTERNRKANSRLRELMADVALTPDRHHAAGDQEYRKASPFLLPLIDYEASGPANSLTEGDRNTYRQLFIGKIDEVNLTLFGPYKATASGEVALGATPFVKQVRAGSYGKAAETLRAAIKGTGLHTRAGYMNAVLERRGFDWCQQLNLIGHALAAKDKEDALRCAKEALSLGRQARLPI